MLRLILPALILLLTLFPFRTAAHAADTFTVTMPAGTEVTMQDPAAALPVTVANNSASKEIRELTFTVDTAKYNISESTIPPDGWCVNAYSTQSITFALRQGSGSCSNGSTTSRIDPGESLLFNILVLPIASAADVTGDTFTSASVGSQGGFTLSGSLPTWTRRSLEAVLSATPESTSTGNVITLTMQVTNRSTASQSAIASSPAPPSYSSAIVTNTSGPYYGSTAIDGSISASATTISVGSTTEFASSGTLRIDSEDICYSAKTATSITGATRGCNSTAAVNHTDGSTAYSLDGFTLAANETRTIVWKYSADINGSVYFSAKALNAATSATSKTVNSNTVVIGDFTSSLTVDPIAVVSGQDVTAQMTVQNNGATSLVNITPSILSGCAGGAAETLVSGPTPASVSTLGGGSSGVFEWTYRITGSIGQAYCLTGSASANGPVVTNTATSNSGSISSYSVTVSPVVVTSGSTNKTFTWSVYNGSGCTVRDVSIETPASGGNWTCSSVTAPSGWSGACASTVSFASGSSANDVPAGGTRSFSITFSTTETVTSDKTVSFPVTLSARGCGGNTNTLGSAVIVSAYALALTHAPAGPINADGSSRYTMTAVLSKGAGFESGKTITFSTNNGSLDPSSASTDINGQAVVALVSPYSPSNTSATVTAAYLNASASDTVQFTGWTKPNILYWGGLSPSSASCGTTVSFQVVVKNVGPSSMNLSSNSYFAFNDYSEGGCSVYKAYLNAGSTGSIASGATKTLTFGSPTNAGLGGGVSISPYFISGAHEPVANETPPPESGMFLTEVVPPNPGPGTNDQYRTVTDVVTLSGNCNAVRINILEWRELR